MLTFSVNTPAHLIFKNIDLTKISSYNEFEREFISDYIEKLILGVIGEDVSLNDYVKRKARSIKFQNKNSANVSIANQSELDIGHSGISESKLEATDSHVESEETTTRLDSKFNDDIVDFLLAVVEYIEGKTGHNLIILFNKFNSAIDINEVEDIYSTRMIFLALLKDYDNLFDLPFEGFLTDVSAPDKIADFLENEGLSFTLSDLLKYVFQEKLGYKIGLKNGQ